MNPITKSLAALLTAALLAFAANDAMAAERPARGSSTDGDLRPIDQRRLDAHLPGALRAFPGCPRLTVHLRADDALRSQFPADPNVKGMGQNCEVWIKGGLPRWMFREVLYHETYHATHLGSNADHSDAMDRAVRRALNAGRRAKRRSLS